MWCRSCEIPKTCSVDRARAARSAGARPLRGLCSTLRSRPRSSLTFCTGSCSRRTPTAGPTATGGRRARRRSAIC
eukprot:scaffold26849_cov30-Phaeocystis_antarctica.AAC.2